VKTAFSEFQTVRFHSHKNYIWLLQTFGVSVNLEKTEKYD